VEASTQPQQTTNGAGPATGTLESFDPATGDRRYVEEASADHS